MANVNAQELEVIKKVLQGFPEGASKNDILNASGLNINWRTLLRRLEVLIAQKEVSVSL